MDWFEFVLLFVISYVCDIHCDEQSVCMWLTVST